MTTSTQTIERPQVTDQTDSDDDTPKFFHYVRKDQVLNSMMTGTMVQALCGEVFPVKKKARPGSPVCPKCKEIYDQLL